MQSVDSNVETSMQFIHCIGMSALKVLHNTQTAFFFFAQFVTISIIICKKEKQKNTNKQKAEK